jgi:hypothetical protein
MASMHWEHPAKQYLKYQPREYYETPEDAEAREDGEAQEPTRESQRYTEPINSDKFEYRSSGLYATLFMETTV